MSVTNMVKNIKDLFPNYVLLLKVGTFYDAYNDDAKIISHLFNYKIKQVSEVDMVGFPVSSLNKVLYILEKRSINYLVVDKKHNYEEETKLDLKKKNKYEEIKEEAIKAIERKNRVNKIYAMLLNNDDVLEKIENLLSERKLQNN